MNGEAAIARPHSMRAANERVLLGHIRRDGPLSRADLARISGLSKPTVSLALASIEDAGLVREAGHRTGMPGPAAVLYEVRPEAGYVLGLDVGRQYIRGAIVDLSGSTRARSSARTKAVNAPRRLKDLEGLADALLDAVGIERSDVTQTVIGSPGVYDRRRDALLMAGNLPGWESPTIPARLRNAFGDHLVIENDIDAAAFAEHAHGHGRHVNSFAFVSIGTGVGMGLVINGNLHRGAHGAAGEIGYLPLPGSRDVDTPLTRRQGTFEAATSAAAIVRAARQDGARALTSARKVFEAAGSNDETAAALVTEEAALVAKAVCAVVTVVDPEIVVLGGGIGQAAGFVDAVTQQLGLLAPVPTEVKVSALGVDAVVDGCVAEGLALAWERLTGEMGGPGGGGQPAR